MVALKPIAVVSSLVAISLAADCALDQPRREGDPSGQQIADAIGAQTNIDGVCAGNWRTGDEQKLENSFNHWGIIYKVSRTDNTQGLRYCKDAIQNILLQCISNGNFWGGVWSLNGETYSLSNSVFPENPLAPTDDGGPKENVPTPIQSASTGPITPAPQSSSVNSGKYTTTTKSIDGLTANSATTTTTEDGGTTSLPVWYVGPGVGIIVIPLAGVPAGGIVPPPVGFPTLTIGEDGEPSSTEKDEPGTTSTSTFDSSTCSSCASCDFGVASISVDQEALGNIDENLPLISFRGTRSAESTETPVKPPIASNALQQPATPIASPVCAPGGIDSKHLIPETLGGTDANLQDLLFRLRQEACAGTCSTAGHGIPGKAVSVLNSNGQCEIRVAITPDIEAYVYRATPITGDQQQQCWDSLESILNTCVDNKANKGWWNGDHEYQFYEAGVRPLNDGSAKNNFQLTNWLGASTVGLTCEKDCINYIPNPDWCNGNCQRFKRRNEPLKSTFSTRRETFHDIKSRGVKKATCGIIMNFPEYPSTSKEMNAEKSGSAATYQEVTSNGWWDYTDVPFNSGMCYRTLRKTNTRTPGKEYATEHIYEKHIVKMYMNWLSFDATEQNGGFNAGQVANCDTMKKVFNTRSSGPNSAFRDQTPADALAATMSCFGNGCPANDRLGEFFILEASVNSLKENVLGEMRKDADFKKLTCDPKKDWHTNRVKLTTISAVFQYISQPAVASVFVQVNNRMRAVLQQLDTDTFYAQYQPNPINIPGGEQIIYNGWLGAYDDFLARFLFSAQEKTRQFADECITFVQEQIQADASLSQTEKDNEVAMMAANRQSGMWRHEVLAFGQGYAGLVGSE